MVFKIENPLNLKIELFENRVLEEMFSGFERVVIRSPLTSGLSGSKVYMVRTIKKNGPLLPSVVKIDYYERIEQEWNAYQSCIAYRLPNVAEIRGKPINPAGSSYSGLWYPLAGAGVDDIDSLQNYLLQAPLDDIAPFLDKRLIKRFKALWQHSTIRPEFNFRAEYDDFLPLNLTVDCTSTKGELYWLAPESVSERGWSIGDPIQVSGFKVVKLLRDEQGLSLDTPEPYPSFRIHVYGVKDVSSYEIGQVIQRPFIGLIKETRQQLLRKLVHSIIGTDMNLESPVLTLPNGRMLPNPLVNWPQILNRSMDVKVAYIHGDLNMENVLVQQDTEDIYLIDFAKSRQDHVIRDLLHLEMAVVNKILSESVESEDLVATTIIDLYQRLHCAVVLGKKIAPLPGQERVFTILHTIRQAARPLLFQMDKWNEYYYGLFIYLLGSLRFGDLDRMKVAPRPKQLAFWGAATILDLMENEPKCTALINDNKLLPRKIGADGKTKKIQFSQDIEELPQFHLDTAIPRQVFVGRTSNITVATRMPNSPKLRESMLQEDILTSELYVLNETQSSEEVEIHFVASNCEIKGARSYTFWLSQEQPFHIFHFQITPQKVSRPDLIFSFFRGGKWVGSAFAKTSAENELVGGVQTNIFTYAIDKMVQTNEQRIKLLNNLVSNLNEDELKNMCYELGIDYENLSGGNKQAKARELVTYCERRGQMRELVQASHNHIPIGALWSTLSRLN